MFLVPFVVLLLVVADMAYHVRKLNWYQVYRRIEPRPILPALPHKAWQYHSELGTFLLSHPSLWKYLLSAVGYEPGDAKYLWFWFAGRDIPVCNGIPDPTAAVVFEICDGKGVTESFAVGK